MPSQGEKKRELLHLSEDNDNLLVLKQTLYPTKPGKKHK